MGCALTNSRYEQRVGRTETELLFMLLPDFGLEDDAVTACRYLVKFLDDTTAGSSEATRIAAVFSDGQRLFALRISSD